MVARAPASRDVTQAARAIEPRKKPQPGSRAASAVVPNTAKTAEEIGISESSQLSWV